MFEWKMKRVVNWKSILIVVVVVLAVYVLITQTFNLSLSPELTKYGSLGGSQIESQPIVGGEKVGGSCEVYFFEDDDVVTCSNGVIDTIPINLDADLVVMRIRNGWCGGSDGSKPVSAPPYTGSILSAECRSAMEQLCQRSAAEQSVTCPSEYCVPVEGVYDCAVGGQIMQ